MARREGERAAWAARLFIDEVFAGPDPKRSDARRRKRDAVRAVTLLDAEPTEFAFSMDDYRDTTRAECEQALAWLDEHEPEEPSRARREAAMAMLSVAHQNDQKKGKARLAPSRALGETVLSGWPEAELLRVAGLFFELGLLRDPAQPDGPLWRSARRDSLRFHEETARRLFPDIDLDDEEAAGVRARAPRRVGA